MAGRNIEKILAETDTSPYYGLNVEAAFFFLKRIRSEYDKIVVILDIFKLGYALGQRALLAEQKKIRKKEKDLTGRIRKAG